MILSKYATEVSEGVYLIDTFALGQKETVAAYLVRGKKSALVDCGYASSHERVVEGIAETGVNPSELDYIVPTHVHLDHAGGAGHLLDRMPRATVYAHERGVPHLVDPTRLVESATKVFGEAVIQMYGKPMPIPPSRIVSVGEMTVLDLGGLSLRMVHTPGHAPHQISVFVGDTGALITADAVGIVYPDVKTLIPTTPPPSFNPDELEKSVRSLEAEAPKRLLVPHYGVRDDPKWVFDQTRRKVSEWLDEVRSMSATKNLDQIADQLTDSVIEEAGVDDVPIYARVSVRSTVMGMLLYLEKSRSRAPVG